MSECCSRFLDTHYTHTYIFDLFVSPGDGARQQSVNGLPSEQPTAPTPRADEKRKTQRNPC